MAQFLLPVIFVVLWSSAFVAGKAGVQHATPFAFLTVRFSIVALIFMAVAVGIWIWQSKGKTSALINSKYKISSKDVLYLINENNLLSENKTTIEDQKSNFYITQRFIYHLDKEIFSPLKISLSR